MSGTEQNTKNDYANWIDIIKAVSTFLIVFHHTVSIGWMGENVNSANWFLLNGLFSFSRMGLPVFFMCSGYGMLSKNRSIKDIFSNYIYNLLFIYLMWMQVYGVSSIIRMIFSHEGNLRVYLNAYIKAIIFGQYHVWFIFVLCGLYAMVPLINKVIEDKKLLCYYIALSFTVTIIFPYIRMLPGFDRMGYTLGSLDLTYVTGYLLFFLLGYYLEKYGTEKIRKYGIALGAISFLLANILSDILSVHNNAPEQQPYDWFGILGFFMCVGLYLLFQGVNIKESNYRKILKPIVECGFGIYMIHPMFLYLVSNYNLRGMLLFLSAFAIYASSLGICMLLRSCPVTKNLFIKHRRISKSMGTDPHSMGTAPHNPI